MSGANNPFWGKNHTKETLDKIEATKRAQPPQRKGGPPKGYRHTPEAREKIKEALRIRWRDNRDKMLAQLPRGEDHHFRKTNYQSRYRVNFNSVQRREWLAKICFYCEATDDLVLDHIIPAMSGGKNVRNNSQTLCGKCNRWKMWFVDKPYHIATLDSDRGH